MMILEGYVDLHKEENISEGTNMWANIKTYYSLFLISLTISNNLRQKWDQIIVKPKTYVGIKIYI